MTNQESFLQSIIEEPDNEDLRLIYADWLEERDDPRGEFIRVQCQLNRMEERDPGRPALLRREIEMLDQYQPVWLKVLPERLWPSIQFRRGLPEGIELAADDFVVHADALIRLGPLHHLR